jgi:hypothetical protein
VSRCQKSAKGEPVYLIQTYGVGHPLLSLEGTVLDQLRLRSIHGVDTPRVVIFCPEMDDITIDVANLRNRCHPAPGNPMNTNALLLSILFGSVGMGMFIYGKKQQRIIHLVAGLALMVCPYFIPNAIALAVVGVILTASPFLIP